MTTVSQLIEQCSQTLHSYTGTVEQATYLTASVDADDTMITVAHPTRILQGLIEIDDELLLVSDQGTTDVTLFPFGRGANGTTAAAHALGTKVTTDPLVPRQRMFEEIISTIRQCSDLYQVKTTSLESSPVVNTYGLPADCRRILKVQWSTIGPSLEWPANRTWSFDPNADVATFPTGKTITIDGYIGVPGQGIQVTYAADLGVPATTADVLEDLGIPAEMHEVLVLGACWRAVQKMAPAKLNARAVEDPTTNGVSPSSIKDVAQQFFSIFILRRQEEKKRLDLQYPPRPHRVR
jgi:hypothetical protein